MSQKKRKEVEKMKRYEVTKINVKTEKEFNLGIYDKEDVKLIVRGYKFNGLFFERKNSDSIYVINAVA